jgi:hypothetical protein
LFPQPRITVATTTVTVEQAPSIRVYSERMKHEIIFHWVMGKKKMSEMLSSNIQKIRSHASAHFICVNETNEKSLKKKKIVNSQ